MSFNFSPKIVTDSLVSYLDAANTRSYPGNGTTWTDLTKNENNGGLISGPIFNSSNGGSISLDGADDYIEIPKTGILSSKSSFTISLWTYPTSLTGIRPLFVNYYVGNQEVLFRFNGTNLQFFTYTSSQIGGTTQTYSKLNQWVNVVATYDGSIMKTYVNGVQSPTTYSQTGNLSTSTLPYLIGRYSSPTEYRYEGRVANTLVYLKSLSATEVLQNYNATKTRFGL
jgi:hypothetical protein